MDGTALAKRPGAGCRHEAVLYEDEETFVAATAPFVKAAVAADEPTLVATRPDNLRLLRDALGADAASVQFMDMFAVGRNPARIIPMWRDFVAAHPGQPVRGIGEPVWPERTQDELDECVAHEALLNRAFQDANRWLVCPYDSRRLEAAAIEAAWRTHPHVTAGSELRASADFRLDDQATLMAPLPDPPATPIDVAFDYPLAEVRRLIGSFAADAGVDEDRTTRLVLAASEVAANTVCHAGGGGRLRMWDHEEKVVCEFRDSGLSTEPLSGRLRPDPEATGGRGLWLVNQLCDLVQIRSGEQGTVVRLHMRKPSG